MIKSWLYCFVLVVVIFYFSGCTENYYDTKIVEYEGVLLDVHVGERSSWVLLDTEYGELKKIWAYSYPVLDSLGVGEYYKFVSELKETPAGRHPSGLKLVEICDEMNATVWSG